MSIESILRLKPWQWNLRARLLWATLFCRRGPYSLEAIISHILDSDRIQSSDLKGGRMAGDRYEVLSHAVRVACAIPGVALEFGVFKGQTLKRIARDVRPDRVVVGFDTFEGLPEDWGELLPKGHFQTALPSFDDYPNVVLQVGQIEETLPRYLADSPPAICLVHIDCPHYSINKFILRHIAPFVPVGGVIVFDEYYGYPTYEEHEYRAWEEIRESFGLETAAIAYSNRSAAFRLSRNPAHGS